MKAPFVVRATRPIGVPLIRHFADVLREIVHGSSRDKTPSYNPISANEITLLFGRISPATGPRQDCTFACVNLVSRVTMVQLTLFTRTRSSFRASKLATKLVHRAGSNYFDEHIFESDHIFRSRRLTDRIAINSFLRARISALLAFFPSNLIPVKITPRDNEFFARTRVSGEWIFLDWWKYSKGCLPDTSSRHKRIQSVPGFQN